MVNEWIAGRDGWIPPADDEDENGEDMQYIVNNKQGGAVRGLVRGG